MAAALYELWTTSAAGGDAGGAVPDIPATAKIYVGIGKKDGATANDLVAVLTKEVRVERPKIGRVELRESFSLVEIPAQDAERVAAALNGVTIRRTRVTARVDRGGPSRPAATKRAAPPAGQTRRLRALAVHQVLQRLARPERGNAGRREGDGLPGAWVAALARRPASGPRSCRTR